MIRFQCSVDKEVADIRKLSKSLISQDTATAYGLATNVDVRLNRFESTFAGRLRDAVRVEVERRLSSVARRSEKPK